MTEVVILFIEKVKNHQVGQTTCSLGVSGSVTLVSLIAVHTSCITHPLERRHRATRKETINSTKIFSALIHVIPWCV